MMRYSTELRDAKQSAADALEPISRKSNSKKQQSQLMISLAVKFLIKPKTSRNLPQTSSRKVESETENI